MYFDFGGVNVGVFFIVLWDGDYCFVGKFMSFDVCGDGIIVVVNGMCLFFVIGDLLFLFIKCLLRGEVLLFVVEFN